MGIIISVTEVGPRGPAVDAAFYNGKELPYGSPCTTDEECRDGKVNRLLSSYGNRITVFEDDAHSICDSVNKRCNCSTPLSRQFKSNNYVCARAVHVHYDDAPTCKLDDPSTCLHGVCTKDILRGPQCICSEGYLYIENGCRKVDTFMIRNLTPV